MRLVSLIMVATACSPPPVIAPSSTGLPAPSVMARFLPRAPGPALCARGNDDRVSRYFCQSPPPSPTSLLELYRGLGLDPGTPGSFVALTAHSTALGIRSVNPLNPRALVFDGLPRDRLSRRRFVAGGFTRGEPIVELVTRDETTQQLRFFVVAATQPCDETASCVLADRLTEEAESGWTSTTLYEDLDLENTALDCLRCHQPEGPGTPRILRMQELRFRWTHFFAPKTQSVTGFEALLDFFTAHLTTERYGGVPGDVVLHASDPNALSQLITQEDSSAQPNEFPGFTIALERESSGQSATWEALAAKAASGEAIPVPWWGLRVTDLENQTAVASQFQRAVRDGRRTDVPELRALHTEEVERATGIRPISNATGREVLVQACGQCHQPRRNQQLTRARFDALRLDAMSPEARQLAADRMRLPEGDPLQMPPAFSTVLTADERARALEALLP
ncbi:MAG: hypothetical protein Q8L14_21145 [Myxococcales bacterium]|nr:hypothetical protein [Myxococcales bacterium]